jgi:hypothetical protein
MKYLNRCISMKLDPLENYTSASQPNYCRRARNNVRDRSAAELFKTVNHEIRQWILQETKSKLFDQFFPLGRRILDEIAPDSHR